MFLFGGCSRLGIKDRIGAEGRGLGGHFKRFREEGLGLRADALGFRASVLGFRA